MARSRVLANSSHFLNGMLIIQLLIALNIASLSVTSDCGEWCSLGKVKPWTGDVWPSEGLRASVAARSFNGELVVIGESRGNPFFQAYKEFKRVGIAHVMWVTNRKEKCDRAEAIFPNELGCGYTSQSFSELEEMHMLRVAYFARALRLVNVLLIDADILVFKVPYPFLKTTLKDVNLLVMRDGNGYANSGCVYAQNAKPDGPAAYVIAEVVDRSLRWLESKALLEEKKAEAPYHHNPAHRCWEQSVYTDTMLSAVAGRPIFLQCWERPEGPKHDAWHEAHRQFFNVTRGLGEASYLKEVFLSQPAELIHPLWGFQNRSDIGFLVNNISVPHFRGTWPPDLGGLAFSPRSSISTPWVDALKADHPLLWPDQDDPNGEAKANLTPKEVIAYFPPWFVHTWSVAGWTGTWSKTLVESDPSFDPKELVRSHGPSGGERKAGSVVAHFVHVPGGATNKITVQQLLGNYDWKVAHKAKAGVGAYWASTPKQEVPEKVVAYGAKIEDILWTSEANFAKAIRILVRIGLLSNRTVAFPTLRPDCSWIMGQNSKELPFTYDHGKFICGDRGMAKTTADGAGPTRCLWNGYMEFRCLKVVGSMVTPASDRWRGGLLPTEYEDWKTSAAGLKSSDTLLITSLSSNDEGLSRAHFASRVIELIGKAPQRLVVIDALLNTTSNGTLASDLLDPSSPYQSMVKGMDAHRKIRCFDH